MGLIDLKTNLRSLSYGSGIGEPYIRRPLPAYNEDPGNPYLGADIFSRQGSLISANNDVTRLTRYITSGKGLLFNAKQLALETSRPKTPYGPKRGYLVSNAVAQAGVQGNGIHLNRNLFFDSKNDGYDYQTRTFYNEENNNRLTLLYNTKISKSGGGATSRSKFGITDKGDQITLMRYSGGSGGFSTTLKRISNTTEYTPGVGKYQNVFTLTNTQLQGQIPDPSIGVRRNTGFNHIGNFIIDVNDSTNAPSKTRILGRLTQYSTFNRPNIFKTGDPGNDANLNRQTYYEGVPQQTQGTDLINYKKIYSSADGVKTQTNSAEDLIKFYIAVLDNNNPQNKTYIHFRAYIEGFQDNYAANWNSVKYPGRGEEFFKYDGFTRDISFSFKVHVASRVELFPTYNKLNYLASIMTPDYSNPGFMRGNIVQLTVGDYINDTYGVITGFSYNLSDETSWDIARKDDGKEDENSAELATLISVDSFSFKPIHNFLPRTVKELDNPESRFISLGNKGYGADKRGI